MNLTYLTSLSQNMIGQKVSMEMSRKSSHTMPQDHLGKPVVTVSYVDANLMHCLNTGRSVTGILHFLNGTLIDWYSKKMSTVETATYGAEFVSARTCVEQLIDLRITLRYLGVPLREKSYMFGDNESVVNSAMLPLCQTTQETYCAVLPPCEGSHCLQEVCVHPYPRGKQPCRYCQQALGIQFHLAHVKDLTIC